LKKDILLCVALKEELDPYKLPPNIQVLYTKVGKINATLAVMNAVFLHRPKVIINFGSAGAVRANIEGLCLIKDVMQRDMITSPLAKRGETPFDSTPPVLTSDIGKFRCATGDSFVTSPDLWFTESDIDLVDMELFAIAKIGFEFGIPWRSAKYVTDKADENAGSSWEESLISASSRFYEHLDEITSV